MVSIPFLNKSNKQSSHYILFLFLSGENVYGLALNEKNPQQTSSLHKEHVDTFLQDVAVKTEAIINHCERELGEEVYLKKTVLFLNSLYTTDSGAIREDFRKTIKKFMQDLDLDNLGYVNFFEAVNHAYSAQYSSYSLLEESVYDYTLYFVENSKVLRSHKIAKTQQEKTDVEEIEKHLTNAVPVIGFFYNEAPKNIVKLAHHVTEKEFASLFQSVYFKKPFESEGGVAAKAATAGERSSVPEEKEQQTPPPSSVKSHDKKPKQEEQADKDEKTHIEETEEEQKTSEVESEQSTQEQESSKEFAVNFELPPAPGFGTHTSEQHEKPTSFEKETSLPQTAFEHESLPQQTKKPVGRTLLSIPFATFGRVTQGVLAGIGGILRGKLMSLIVVAVGILALAGAYLFFLHSAEVKITTRKENFSSAITFGVGGAEGLGEVFATQFSVEESVNTSGEETTGEKAAGKIAVYNKRSSQQELPSGTVFKAGDIGFILKEAITVPAASESTAAGSITFGKKETSAEAQAIGPEGNIADGAKLSASDFGDDIYAYAQADFSGGFRKVVEVFSKDDAAKLEEKTAEKIKKGVTTQFQSKKSEGNFLFLDTFKIVEEKKEFSVKVGKPAEKVSLVHSGTAETLYVPEKELAVFVQEDKLNNQEFVGGTFTLKNTQLKNKQQDTFTYSARAGGQVQRFIDKEKLLEALAGMSVNKANRVLDKQITIKQYSIVTRPLPLSIMPFKKDNIDFTFID